MSKRAKTLPAGPMRAGRNRVQKLGRWAALTLAAAAALGLAAPAAGTNFRWTDSDGGSFRTATNWSPHIPSLFEGPGGAGDTVIFDLGRESLVRIPTLEPLRGTKAHVGALLEASNSAEELVDSLTKG